MIQGFHVFIGRNLLAKPVKLIFRDAEIEGGNEIADKFTGKGIRP
jgi:hypothetical protein